MHCEPMAAAAAVEAKMVMEVEGLEVAEPVLLVIRLYQCVLLKTAEIQRSKDRLPAIV